MFKPFSFNFILFFSFCYKHLYYKIIAKLYQTSLLMLESIQICIDIQIFIIDVNKILNNQYNISRDFPYPNTYSKIYDTSNKWKTSVRINLPKLFKLVSNL